MTSLISFDPKSNTLIRVQEHQNDSSEEEENIKITDTNFINSQKNLNEFDELNVIKDFNKNQNLQNREISASQVKKY